MPENVFQQTDHVPVAAPPYPRVDLVRNDCGEHCVIELELTEPMLYFRQAPMAAALLVQGVIQ